MINYNISGFFLHFELLSTLIALFEENPTWQREDTEIYSVFGSFSNVIWNGGRGSTGRTTSLTKMADIIRFFNDRNIGVNYTYSNALIEEIHLHDYLSNETLKMAHNEMNGIIVNNSLFETYIRENYPRFKILSSCTANKLDEEYIKNRIKEVDILVLPPELNQNLDFINSLDDKSKLEILVNESCTPNCPVRSEHYNKIAQTQLFSDPLIAGTFWMENCPSYDVYYDSINDRGKFIEIGSQPMHVKFDQVKELANKGIKHFKITGRDLHLNIYAPQLGYYLIKDEYRAAFYEKIYYESW